jgi:hypothetical protein
MGNDWRPASGRSTKKARDLTKSELAEELGFRRSSTNYAMRELWRKVWYDEVDWEDIKNRKILSPHLVRRAYESVLFGAPDE